MARRYVSRNLCGSDRIADDDDARLRARADGGGIEPGRRGRDGGLAVFDPLRMRKREITHSYSHIHTVTRIHCMRVGAFPKSFQ